jgi:hypothetical protein
MVAGHPKHKIGRRHDQAFDGSHVPPVRSRPVATAHRHTRTNACSRHQNRCEPKHYGPPDPRVVTRNLRQSLHCRTASRKPHEIAYRDSCSPGRSTLPAARFEDGRALCLRALGGARDDRKGSWPRGLSNWPFRTRSGRTMWVQSNTGSSGVNHDNVALRKLVVTPWESPIAALRTTRTRAPAFRRPPRLRRSRRDRR